MSWHHRLRVLSTPQQSWPISAKRLWQCTCSRAEGSKQGAIARRKFPKGRSLAITLQSVSKLRPNSAKPPWCVMPLSSILFGSCHSVAEAGHGCAGSPIHVRLSMADLGRLRPKHDVQLAPLHCHTDRSAISKGAQCWQCGVYSPDLHLPATCVAHARPGPRRRG